MRSAPLLLALAALAAGCAATKPAPDRTPVPPPAPPAPPARTPPPPPSPPAPPVRLKTLQKTLPSGLRVVVIEEHRRPVVSLRLVFPRGAAADAPGAEGATFLAVSMATDYYEKTPEGRELIEEKSLRRQFAELGAAAWSDVGSDSSLLAVDGYAVDAGKYLQLLAAALGEPRHGEMTFVARRDAMLDALEDLELADGETLVRHLEQAAFGGDHPYGKPVTGTLGSLANLPYEDVVTAQAKVLKPKGATLLVVGDVLPEATLAYASKVFAGWRGAPAASPAPAPPRVPKQAEVGFIQRKPASTVIVCATRPLSDVKAGDATLEVLTTVLGRGIDSRLAQALREENRLTYTASADVVRRRSARAFIACAYLRAEQAELGVKLFRDTLESLRTGAVTPEELARARAVQRADLERAWDDLPSALGTWLRALNLGLTEPDVEEHEAALARVTAEDVSAAAKKMFERSTLRWVVSGEFAPTVRAVEKGGLGSMKALSIAR